MKVKPDRSRKYDQYDTFHKKQKRKTRDVGINAEMLVEEKLYIEDVCLQLLNTNKIVGVHGEKATVHAERSWKWTNNFLEH